MEVSGLGIKSELQLQPIPQLWQHWTLNPWCHSGNSCFLFLLIDLLKYYEGDSNSLYEAHSKAFDDGYGNTTRGFGATNDESVNQKNAYEKMCKDLKHRAKQVKNFLNKILK